MKKAFTMIELVMVIVVLGIVSGVAINIVKFSYDNEQRSRALNELEIKSQVAMDFISVHLNNGVKNSYRLKREEDSDCSATTNCKFVFNTSETIAKNSVTVGNFKIFEWARIAIKDKRLGKWDGINQTKCVVNKVLNTNCYKVAGQFSCFTGSDCDIKSAASPVEYNYNITGNYGIYFLGDNIANSTAFMENDLYNLEKGIIYFDLSKKNFSMSNAYVLVDKIEGLVYKDKKLEFYSYDWSTREKTNFSSIGKTKSILVDEISDFAIYNDSGVTRINLCLERAGLPGSFIHKSTTIRVCKTGVII
ncbi:type II secretion system protein [Campylobacter sp. MG1]|uniref:type II secretion system protein n=1 Tax=Campylobacter sp. MG1 TaxID=2976332 RepID=UPI00226CBF10|nr:type II secretion system protein [Campylobacter sp. MG1]